MVHSIPERQLGSMARAVSGGNARDVAVGMKLREYRDMFNIPRRLIQSTSGVSKTTIGRVENGIRPFSTHSLANTLAATRSIVKTLHPQRIREYDKWEREMILLVAAAETERRERKAQRASQREE